MPNSIRHVHGLRLLCGKFKTTVWSHSLEGTWFDRNVETDITKLEDWFNRNNLAAANKQQL